MDFIQSILFYFITGLFGATVVNVISAKVNKRFNFSTSQKEVFDKKLIIYKRLYLGAVKNPYGRYLSLEDQYNFLINFCSDFESSTDLFLYLSPKCIYLLDEFNRFPKNNEINTYRSNIQEISSVIEKDFSSIKEKLGYSNELKAKRNIELTITLVLVAMLYLLFAIFNKTFNPNLFNQSTWISIGFTCSLLLIPITFSLFYLADNRVYIYSKKLKIKKGGHNMNRNIKN